MYSTQTQESALTSLHMHTHCKTRVFVDASNHTTARASFLCRSGYAGPAQHYLELACRAVQQLGAPHEREWGRANE